MLYNMFSSLFGGGSQESFVSVDIGSNSIKVMELDVSGGKPRLINAGMCLTPAHAIQNNIITKTDAVAESIRSLIEANGITATRVVSAVPGPSVFTKKITTGFVPLRDLRNNLTYEASNYIPHNISAVHLDYQVLRANGKSSIDVLLVAVKNDIIKSFVDTIDKTGLETAIVDVDYFALENMFSLCYPEEFSKTVALVNIGARYTTVNILQEGLSLFTGDVAVGGRLYTDALCSTASLEPLAAEQVKMGNIPDDVDQSLVRETIDRTTEHVASELHRQIGFFWNAAATDKSIEAIYVCGGGSQVGGLIEELSSKTGLTCNIVEPWRGVEGVDRLDSDYASELSPLMGVSVGLAMRRSGDKEHAIS